MRSTIGTTAAALAAAACLLGGTARAADHEASGGRTVLDTARTGGGTHSRLQIKLTGRSRLTAAQRGLLAQLGAELRTAGARQGTAVLKCNKNPHWSDSRGRLDMRFNCRYSTINWGFKISRKLQSIITGPVHEDGARWWKNGKRMPKNASHTVGAGYHFHGTFKPVHRNAHIQAQDYMKFRVNIGGRPGTGTLTWAINARTKK